MKRLATIIASLFLFGVLAGCHHNHKEHHHGHDHSHGMGHNINEDEHEEDDEDEHHKEDMHGDHEEGKKKHEGEVHLSPSEMRAIAVDTVGFGDFAQVIVTTGEILPTTKGEAIITAPFSGTVAISGELKLGGVIKASQTAFVISTNVGEASTVVERAAIELEAAKKEYERDVVLNKEQIVSDKEVSECKERYEQAKVKFASLSSKISQGKSYAKSPIDGFVKNILVTDGVYVNAGDPLATVTQSDKLMLRVKFPQRYQSVASSVKTVRFRTAYSDVVYLLDMMDGKQISQSVTTSDGGYFIPMLFEFNNIENVMSGTSVECYVVTNNKKNVITVPNSAIAEDQGVAQVFVKKHEDAFKKQFVKLGATDGVRTEILEGLHSGDIVATSYVKRLHLASSSNAIPAHSHSH